MDNPIILLIFWGLVNLLLKSSKDKKKAEDAKRRRINQGNLSQNTSTIKKPKSIIEVFKEEIEKEIQREKEAQQKKQRPAMQERKPTPKPEANQRPKQTLMSQKTPEQIKMDRENYFQATDLGQMDGIKEGGDLELVRISGLAKGVEGKTKSSFNIKNDLLKGIIYSEVLSEPKALKNMKR